jgi:methionine-rich copper-binding protein CopC
MDPSSVLYLSSPNILFDGPTWLASNTVLTLHPTNPLTFGQVYSFTITGRDVAGNPINPAFSFGFTTAAMADTTPPTMVASQPNDLMTGVATTVGFTVTFSEPMNPASVTVTSVPAVTLGTPSWASNNTELSVSPLMPLAATTPYQVTLTGNDASGNPLAAGTHFAFTTAMAPDLTPPVLNSSIPTADAGNVAITTALSLTFSEPMNVNSLNLALAPDSDRGVPTWTNGDRTATWSAPAADWASSTNYAITISGTDVAGNPLGPTTLAFTTATPADITPPTVVSSVPEQGNTGVPQNTTIEINFSEPVNQTATESAFSIPGVTCAFTWNAARTLMVCRPTVLLLSAHTYQVTLGTGAVDDAGNPLAAAWNISFTTASMPDLTPPTVTATVPLNNAIGVNRFAARNIETPIVVTFSEAMSQASVQGAFSVTSPAGLNGGTFSWNHSVMTYSPPSAFPYNAQVTFVIGGGATDLAGNHLAAYTGTFRVKRQATTRFYASGTIDSGGTSALDGYLYGDASCTTATITLNAGTSIAVAGDLSTAGQIYRGFLSFDLSALNALVGVNVSAATLNAQQVGCYGNPFTAPFGSAIEAWHVSYGASLTAADCATPNLGSRQYVLSTSTTLSLRTVSVVAAVADDYTNRVLRGYRTQFLIRTHTLANSGTTADWCDFGTFNQGTSANDPYLNVTYEYD